MEAKDIKECIAFVAKKENRHKFEVYIIDEQFPCNPDDEGTCKLLLQITLEDNVVAGFYANPALENMIQQKMKSKD